MQPVSLGLPCRGVRSRAVAVAGGSVSRLAKPQLRCKPWTCRVTVPSEIPARAGGIFGVFFLESGLGGRERRAERPGLRAGEAGGGVSLRILCLPSGPLSQAFHPHAFASQDQLVLKLPESSENLGKLCARPAAMKLFPLC